MSEGNIREGDIRESAIYRLYLPDLGEGLAQAIITSWAAAEGEHVTEGQPLVSVETDKAIVEIPAPVTGTLSAIITPAGSTVPVGECLARLIPE